jgi:predicted metal-dependent phosphotriesterase family hydrolase
MPVLFTVTGLLPLEDAGVVDAHNHLWIDPVPQALNPGPLLNDEAAIALELSDYRQAGGGAIIDCQPAGCGRDGRKLIHLSHLSGVHVIAATGYHLPKYYPSDYWLFSASPDAARQFFVQELTEGLEETRRLSQPARAGFIKAACPAVLSENELPLLEAAAAAALETGAAVAVHTEKGASAEHIIETFASFGLPPARIVLFHMDKRPDFALHRDLAQAGCLLEYDTFYRPQYHPLDNLWPLLERMVGAGLSGQIAVGTDMAEAAFWINLGGAPGLAGLFTHILPQMRLRGWDGPTIRRLVGENIAARLARKAVQLSLAQNEGGIS